MGVEVGDFWEFVPMNPLRLQDKIVKAIRKSKTKIGEGGEVNFFMRNRCLLWQALVIKLYRFLVDQVENILISLSGR